jgi:phage-related protein
MTDTFNWRVHSTASGGGEIATSKSQFGDGYSQELPLGLNSETQRWTVTVSGYAALIDEVLAFIRAKQGAESFYWTPPRGAQGYYRCKRYNTSDVGGAYFTLQMEFEQVFTP